MNEKSILKNGASLIVREALPKDAAALVPLLQQVPGESDYLNTSGIDYAFTKSETKRHLKKYQALEHSVFLLAFIDARLVASLSCQGDGRDKLRHSATLGMGVGKEYWGLGVGSALMAAAIKWARQAGIKKLNLSVRADNQAGLALYKKNGFVIEGERSRFHCIDDIFYSAYLMGLEIN